MELKVKDMTYDQALYIAKETVKWQKYIGTLNVETACEVIEVLLNKIDTLNKGIDELIKKYEDILKCDEKEYGKYKDNKDTYYDTVRECYRIKVTKDLEFIQDLKKLKGSE